MSQPAQIFDFLRYASVWEDAEVLCKAFRPRADARLLSICSSGDNVLALLTLSPKEVVAADLNPAQLACLDLRLAAFQHLSYQELLAFLGVLPSEERVSVYQDILRKGLSPPKQAYWDKHLRAIRDGVIHSGKFERYLRAFGRRILPLIHSTRKRKDLFAAKSRREQIRFYEQEWDTWRWRLLFRIFFSRFVMGRWGRDPSFFHEVQGTTAERILSRTRHALTEIPTHLNPYLRYILHGNFTLDCLPLYLRKESFAAIREGISKVKIVQGSAEQTELGPFDGFNLSDIFEYMDAAAFERCYGSLLDQANPGARLVYWNMLVDRSCPSSFQSRIRPHADLAQKLHKEDQAWFYQKLIIEEVRG